MNSRLFQTLPIGTLFFRNPFNKLENPSIKVDDNHARKPSGNVIEVNGGVLVFTHPVSVVSIPLGLDQYFETLETSLEIK